MRKILFICMVALFSNAIYAQTQKKVLHPEFIKVMTLDGETNPTVLHAAKVTPAEDKMSGIITDLVTETVIEYSIIEDEVTFPKSGPSVSSSTFLVPDGAALSCTCCKCGCSFSARLVSWGCATCPRCHEKLSYIGCLYNCGWCIFPCELFIIA